MHIYRALIFHIAKVFVKIFVIYLANVRLLVYVDRCELKYTLFSYDSSSVDSLCVIKGDLMRLDK